MSKPQPSLLDVWAVKPKANSANDPRRPEQQDSVVEPNAQNSHQNNLSAIFLKHGHAFSYTALFLFTLILYARPAEFYPSAITASIALVIGIATLGCFIPTQLSLEGTLTARPREVNLVLLFCLTGLLSVPFAINRQEAWVEFSGTFIRCIVIFVVIVNVVRTEARLKGLIFLAIFAGIWLSAEAINDYRLGLMTVEGYRAAGRGTGIFGNTNDMALHLVTILPISVALMLGSKGAARKLLYGASAAVMISAIVLSYSRGAFIGMLVVFLFIAWKLGRQRRLEIVFAVLGFAGVVVLLAPDKYGNRLLSIFIPSLDAEGSADARRGELFRSIYIALRHPLFGIGMGNYQPEMSYKGLVTHNSYTQVGAEMGMTALACYVMFIVTPLKKLGQIARETFETRRDSRFYYLALGLQASLIAYLISSFFLSVAYVWYVYYLVGYAVCLRRLYESETGRVVAPETSKEHRNAEANVIDQSQAVMT
ncbi:MAG TPA: O-antigen ligase family protein [Pyrinomonadaceae bacterium]|nr:O-antigen ligase family protein [Pyrinomonadaceae bacterium]